MQYSEKTIYRKAQAIGYSIHKGFIHFLSEEYPVYDRTVGYNIVDEKSNTLVYECHNQVYDHLMNLEEVEQFIKEQYILFGLSY